VDPRIGLDDMERRKFLTLRGHKLRPLARPAHSQSLYRLRHPGSLGYVPYYIFNDGHKGRRNGRAQNNQFVCKIAGFIKD
jgi:hypothetical protein